MCKLGCGPIISCIHDTYTYIPAVLVLLFVACLRMQSDPSNKDFEGLSPERAYADYVLANMVLFLAAWNYIG